MHILYLCQYFPPDLGAPAIRCFEMSRRWVRAGHRVTVVCGIPNHPSGRIAQGYTTALVQTERVEGISVYRSWVYVTPNAGGLRRSVNYASFCISAVLTSELIRDVDVCIASSPQLLVGMSGLMVRTLRRIPLCFEVRDLWPDSIEAVEASLPPRLLSGLRALERRLYRKADHIVAVSPAFVPTILERGGQQNAISVIPNGIDPVAMDAIGPHRDWMPDAFRSAFLVGYVGTLGMAHGLETIFEAAKLLEDEPDIHFVLMGDGARRSVLDHTASTVPNVTILPPGARARALAVLRGLDVGLVLLRDTPLFRTVIPSKLLETMGAGIPVILGVRGQAAEILEACGGGLAIPPEDGAALASAVRALKEDPRRRESMGRAGRDHVTHHYHLDHLADRYLTILQEMSA